MRDFRHYAAFADHDWFRGPELVRVVFGPVIGVLINNVQRRRFKEKNETFTQLLTRVRKDLVGQYMADRRLLLSEISYMLGFSEQSAFSRAYKRWFGISPKLARSSA